MDAFERLVAGDLPCKVGIVYGPFRNNGPALDLAQARWPRRLFGQNLRALRTCPGASNERTEPQAESKADAVVSKRAWRLQ